MSRHEVPLSLLDRLDLLFDLNVRLLDSIIKLSVLSQANQHGLYSSRAVSRPWTYIVFAPLDQAHVKPHILVLFDRSQDPPISGVDRFRMVRFASVLGQVGGDLGISVIPLLHSHKKLVFGIEIP
jgi:hypothetical protein